MEKWKDISGFEGKYRISSDGKVFSVRNNKTLSIYVKNSGYKAVSLGANNQKHIHRLIAETFIPNPNSYTEVNHIDGNKLNNDIANLEWCTPSQNNTHSYRVGLKTVSEKQKQFIKEYIKKHRCKQVGQYDLSGSLIKVYPSVTEAAKTIGEHASTIGMVCRGNRSHSKYIFRYEQN